MKMSPFEILRLLQKKFRFSSEESKSITSTLVARKRKLVDLRVARIKVERRAPFHSSRERERHEGVTRARRAGRSRGFRELETI